jgi:hypothetical protein
MNIIFLIISSDDVPEYKEMREISRVYYKKMSEIYNLKYFYLESKEELQTDIEEKDDVITIRGKDSIIPGIFIKTMNAMKYIHAKYEYDFIVRTNLSSFWNIHNFFKYTNLFDPKVLTGIVPFNSFVSGTGIILSKYVTNIFIKTVNINPSQSHDDVLISNILKCSVKMQGLPHSMMPWLIYNEKNVIPEDVSEILYFRIKNEKDRRIDIQLFKQLMVKVYGIEHI